VVFSALTVYYSHYCKKLVMNELLATFRVRFSQPVSILGHSSIASWSYLTSRKQFDYVYERNSCRRICKIIFSYV